MEKRLLHRQEKKLRRPHSIKKHQRHLNLLTQTRKTNRGPTQDDKEKKIPPLLWLKEVQSFFDLQKDSKNLTIEKIVEKEVFMAGPYEDYELSYVALCDAKYLKRVLKMSGIEKKTKDLIKQALAKT